MRLAAKLVLLFLVGVLLIVGLFSYLTIQANQRLAIDEHERYAQDLAATLRSTMAEREMLPQELDRYLTQSSRVVQHVRVRWVELYGQGESSPSIPVETILAQREITTFSRSDPAGQRHFYTYLPVSDSDDASAGHIEVAAPDTSAQQRWKQSLFSSLIALGGVATLSGVVILIGGVTMVGKPLNQLITKVHRVGEGDFDHPVDIRSGDELGRLGAALNQMCDQLSAQRDELKSETASRVAAVEQLRHADRLSTAGRLAAGIAHEIGTPLNVVIGRAQLIQRDEQASEQVKQDAEVIVSEAKRITGIVRELLDFTRGRKPDRTMQSINNLVRSTVDLMQPMAKKQQVELEANLPITAVLAPVDAQQIQQLLTNLIVNAIQSTDADGRVTVTLQSDDRHCQIRVIDNGSGISPDDIDHLFEPFFTTKDVGEGTGLGLSISHGIAREHDGHIDVESDLGQGSRFTVTLPLTNPSTPEGSSA